MPEIEKNTVENTAADRGKEIYDENESKVKVDFHPYRYDEFILKEIASGGTLMTGTREEVRRFCEAELTASVNIPVLDKLIDNAETARQNHIAEMKEKEISQETEFLEHDGCYAAIYQIRNLPENRDISFMDLDYLEKNGLEPDRERYSFVYSFEVLPEDLKDKDGFLNKVYAKFNLDHPKDFTCHSLSVSDVIAINNHGEITSHFVDSFDFTEIKGFVKERENPLKAVEDAVEQNDNSFDGIINNEPEDVEMSDADESKASERKSILSLLKDTNPNEKLSDKDEKTQSKSKVKEAEL